MKQILSFKIKDKLMGIEIQHVKEINRNISATEIMGAPDYIAGLYNMRGQIITLFSVDKALGFTGGRSTHGLTCVVLKSSQNADHAAGIVIDKAEDVLSIELSQCEAIPASSQKIERRILDYVVRFDEGIMTVLKPDLVTNALQYAEAIRS